MQYSLPELKYSFNKIKFSQAGHDGKTPEVQHSTQATGAEDWEATK